MEHTLDKKRGSITLADRDICKLRSLNKKSSHRRSRSVRRVKSYQKCKRRTHSVTNLSNKEQLPLVTEFIFISNAVETKYDGQELQDSVKKVKKDKKQFDSKLLNLVHMEWTQDYLKIQQLNKKILKYKQKQAQFDNIKEMEHKLEIEKQKFNKKMKKLRLKNNNMMKIQEKGFSVRTSKFKNILNAMNTKYDAMNETISALQIENDELKTRWNVKSNEYEKEIDKQHARYNSKSGLLKIRNAELQVKCDELYCKISEIMGKIYIKQNMSNYGKRTENEKNILFQIDCNDKKNLWYNFNACLNENSVQIAESIESNNKEIIQTIKILEWKIVFCNVIVSLFVCLLLLLSVFIYVGSQGCDYFNDKN
eukprot:219171_1